MQPRMQHPAMIVPDAMSALQAVGKSVYGSGLPRELVEMVNLLRQVAYPGSARGQAGAAGGARRSSCLMLFRELAIA